MISNLKTLLLLVILSFNYTNSKATSDSLKIERYKKHVISLDYISRHTNNNKYYLSLTSNYCDSIIKIDNENLFAKLQKKKINLTLATCDQNMNHKIELFPFFNGLPNYMGFADDPIEYAYDESIEKLLSTKYLELQNIPIANTNITSVIIRKNCNDEMFEIVNQTIHKNTNHHIIQPTELREILGNDKTEALLNGKLNESIFSILCEKLNLDKIGIFIVDDLDVIEESIWLVQTEFLTYSNLNSYSEPLNSKGFNHDKRHISFITILLLFLKSILLISALAFFNQNIRQIINNGSSAIKDVIELFLKKLRFVSTFFLIPAITSFFIIYSLSYLMPEPEDHYLEFSAKLWIALLTLGMSLMPTLINLYFVNRMNLDGFHTLKGYRFFANASLYASYFPLFVFYIILFDDYPMYAHLFMVFITLIIGDLLAKSYFNYSSTTQNIALKKASFIGLILGIISLLIFNSIILTGLNISNLLLSFAIILPLNGIYSLSNSFLIKRYKSQIKNSIKFENFQKFPFVDSLINIENDIYNRITSNINDEKLNIMLISGPAGIGKTRSLIESKNRFIKNGWDWYYGDCDEVQGENSPTYEPFLEAFRKLLNIDEFALDRGQKIENSLSKAVQVGSSIVSADSLINEYSKSRDQTLTDLCIEIIEKLETNKKRIIFIMEDIHWIDEESYAFFKSFIKHVNRNKFLRGNMCIILTIRNKVHEQDRGPSYDKLYAELNELNSNSSFGFSINKLLNKKDFKLNDFVKNLSKKNNQFKIQNSSLNEINNLFNQTLDPNDNLGQITPLYIFQVIESWIKDKILIYDPAGYFLSRPIDDSYLPNTENIDSFYHSIIDQYDEKWRRLLESASIIGNKFNADILSQVWSYELLDVLGFLEKAVNDGLLIDVSDEDNIYKFFDKRIVSSIKSYFNNSKNESPNVFSGRRQIVLEYNKRYLQLQSHIIENPHGYHTEEILKVIRRLTSLLYNVKYKEIAEKLILEVVVRLFEKREGEKLAGFSDFIISFDKLKDVNTIVLYLKELVSFSISIPRTLEIKKIVSELKFKEGSVAYDLRLYLLLYVYNKHESINSGIDKTNLRYIGDKVKSQFTGIPQFSIGFLAYKYAVEHKFIKPANNSKDFINNKGEWDEDHALDAVFNDIVEDLEIESDNDYIALDDLRNFYNYVNEKNINYESRIQLHKLKRLCKTENPDKNYINNASIDLYNNIMISGEFELIKSVLIFRLEVLSNLIEDDNIAINLFRDSQHILLRENKHTIQWVELTLEFMNTNSGSIYLKNHLDEAINFFNTTESYLNKIIDFKIYSNLVSIWAASKYSILIETKKHKEAIQHNLKHLERIKSSIGINNQDYINMCIDIAKAYEYFDNGKKSTQYRLEAIKISESQTNTDNAKELAVQYANISHVYRNKLNDSKKALKYALKSLDIKETMVKDKSYGISLYHVGRALEMDNQYVEAISIFKKAFDYFPEDTDRQKFQKLVLELNLGICEFKIDFKLGLKRLTSVLKKIKTKENQSYSTKEILSRIKLAEDLISKK